MKSENNNVEMLKYILENSLHPEALDAHPWTKSLVVREAVAANPELQDKGAGRQLVITIASHFTRMIPAAPPKGDLDSAWGAFGILAAQYFAPLVFGSPAPASLHAAQANINESILLFVFGRKTPTAAQKERYTVIENDFSLNGTLGDWHEQGLKRLANTLAAREHQLSKTLAAPSVIPVRSRSAPQIKENTTRSRKKIRTVPLLLLVLLLVLVALLGFKAWRIYSLANLVQRDTEYLQKLVNESGNRSGRLKNMGAGIEVLRRDFTDLKQETEPLFWMGPYLKWVPNYGNELASIRELAALSDSLLESAYLTYQAVTPLIDESELSAVNPTQLAQFLQEVQPQLVKAQHSLAAAAIARENVTLENLSPEVRDLIQNDADPLLRLMYDGLTVAVEFPRMMGATDAGPQRYLLLVQNEDELRPTGGFITAAGVVTLKDGDLGEPSFINSGDLDSPNAIYPAAPWQLSEYMNSSILVFRDANWYTNYPTAAVYARSLYAYIDNQPVAGVIAFDQHVLVELLRVTGPLTLDNTPYPIDADNVVAYMRASKTPTAEESASTNWTNKTFLNKLTHALLTQILSGQVRWEVVSAALVKILNERHILIQTDNIPISALLARYGWDGAVHPPETGDFLMAVDTNIGFNKTNAVVTTSMTYDVDLTDLSAPTSSLTIIHKNDAQNVYVCKHWLKDKKEAETGYPISDCYWNYLRVYTPAGTKLLNATPQSVPDNWMINKQKKPGQVNILEEDIKGTQAFGTLQVVPNAESLSVNFQFALPPGILNMDANRVTYYLKVQKQPGTLAIPLTLRVHPAQNTSITAASSGAVLQNGSVLYKTDLAADVEFEVVFSVP